MTVGPPANAAPLVTLRVLVVDDEPLARRGARVRLDRLENVAVVGECGSGRDAIRAIEALSPDVVLLDVQMPGLDGFGVIDAVGGERMPVVIFLTAYDRHAIKAFEAEALDYLLKPIDDERFAVAIARARRRVEERRLHGRASGERHGRPPAGDDAGGRIVVRDRGRILLIESHSIDWIAAEGDYVRIYVAGRGHLHRETMAAMETRLDPKRFARIHRSTIVNMSRIRELRPCGDRELAVVLRDGTSLKASRAHRDRLRVLTADAR